MKYNKCVHDIANPQHSLVVNPVTFGVLCGWCKVRIEDFAKVDSVAEAYDRAMSIVGKRG